MSESDSYVINKFKDMAMSDRTEMLNKQIAWIPDSNGSSYNGQLVFDLSELGQAHQWLSYNEAYIQIPYVIAAKASSLPPIPSPDTTDYSTKLGSESIFIKDGFHQLIDSMAVEVGGKTVCQVQNFTNVHTTFKLMTSCSSEDINKNGSSIGFLFDDYVASLSDGYKYNNVSTANGIGYILNDTINRPSAFMNDVATQVTDMPLMTEESRIKSGISYFKKVTGATSSDTLFYYVYMAQIRLRDITDFFDKIPLCKTTDIRLTIVYNSAQVTITSDADKKLTTSVQQLSGHTVPFMVKYKDDAPASTSLVIRSNIIKNGLYADPTIYAINQCRLYVPIYKIADSVNLAMIQSYPTTKFEYNDIYSYNVAQVTAGSSMTHTLTTGVVNPKYVVVIPFPKTNGLVGLGCSTYQSVFDSAPGTFNQITLEQFNVQIGGLNVFQQDIRYDWEIFANEVAKINALSGNNEYAVTSGVLNLNDWQNAYKFYVADVSRREVSNDNVTKSIVINFRNGANVDIELICFVVYRKSLSIQTSTGVVSD